MIWGEMRTKKYNVGVMLESSPLLEYIKSLKKGPKLNRIKEVVTSEQTPTQLF